MSEAHEYCAVHDRPLGWCPTPDACREIMKGWGLYPEGTGKPVSKPEDTRSPQPDDFAAYEAAEPPCERQGPV